MEETRTRKFASEIHWPLLVVMLHTKYSKCIHNNVNKKHDYKITKYDVLDHKHGGYQG